MTCFKSKRHGRDMQKVGIWIWNMEAIKLKEKRVSRNLETRLHKLVGLTGFEPATP